MTIPVVLTRLIAPKLPHKFISRQVLLEKIDNHSKSRLILVEAPGGYGKTTLIVDWLQSRQKEYVWLTAEHQVKDPRFFLQYIFASLCELHPEFKESIWQSLQLQPQLDSQYILSHLINQFYEMNLSLYLVLDDFHLMDSKENREILTFLLENLPVGISIILTSRKHPDLPLARFRAKQSLLEIDKSDLQFSSNHIDKLLSLYDLDQEEVIDLREACQRNEGWISGIGLVILHYKRSRSLSTSYIKEYMFEEILKDLDSTLVSFLYKTSILSYLNQSLCDHLIEDPANQSKALLEQLYENNIFIEKVERKEDWYRLHPLFSQMLESTREIDVSMLHKKAAYWFWQKKMLEECFYHFIASQDYEETISFLQLCWGDMEREFIFIPWLKWAKSIPAEEKQKHPLFLIQMAWAHLNMGQLQEYLYHIKVLEENFTLSVLDRNVIIQLYGAKSYYHLCKGYLEKTLFYSEKMKELISSDDLFLSVQADSYEAIALWRQGDLERAYGIIQTFRDQMQLMGTPAYALGSYLALIQIRTLQCRYKDAQQLVDESTAFNLQNLEHLKKLKAGLHLKAATLFFDMGEKRETEESLNISMELSESESLLDFHYQLNQFQALQCESLGRYAKALDYLENAEHLFFQTPAVDELTIEEQRFRLYIKLGKKGKARAMLQAIQSGEAESKSLLLARYDLAFSKEDETLTERIDQLLNLEEKAKNQNRIKSQFQILILLCCLYRKINQVQKSLFCVNTTLQLFEVYPYKQIFLLEQELLTPLLREFSRSLKESDSYEIITDFINANLSINRLLSEREIEVLQLMAEGLSNKEIAEKLFVAETTIKGHNQRLFQKLNVSRRTEAVAEAKNLNIIQ